VHFLIEQELARGRLLVQVEAALRARVHERGGDDGQRRVDCIGLVDVEDKVGVLYDVHPEAEWQRVGLPGVDSVRVGDAVQAGLFVEEVEEILD